MGPYLGDFKLGNKIYVYWSSYDKSGASITIDTDGSIQIYKDNISTPKSTSNGITNVEDFSSITGIHVLIVDTNITSGDSGFWEIGHDYFIVINGAVVDGESVNSVIGSFSIENRFDINEDIDILISKLPELVSDQVLASKLQVEVASLSSESIAELSSILKSLNSQDIDLSSVTSILTELSSKVSLIEEKTSQLAFVSDKVKAEIEIIEKKIISSSGIKSKTSKITTGVL